MRGKKVLRNTVSCRDNGRARDRVRVTVSVKIRYYATIEKNQYLVTKDYSTLEKFSITFGTVMAGDNCSSLIADWAGRSFHQYFCLSVCLCKLFLFGVFFLFSFFGQRP